jgi:hypothetical protein
VDFALSAHHDCDVNKSLVFVLLLVAACGHKSSVRDQGVSTDASVDGGSDDVDMESQLGAEAYNLGMNVPGLSYYDDYAFYADVALAVSGNYGPWDNGSAAATLDATGAPTVAASTNFPSDYPSGAYTMTWDGTGKITVASGATLGAVSTTMSGGVMHNTATLTLVSKPSAWVSLNAMPPVTNFHLMATSPNVNAGSMFVKQLLDRMRPFSTLRFMDPLNTNNSTIQNWSQRTWPTQGSRAGTAQGMAYEDIIALANETKKDVWINVPVLATDDYVCRLARLFRYGEGGDKTNSACSPTAPAGTVTTPPLNATSHVYVEFANEIWNSGFQQIRDVYCMVWGVPDTNWGPSCNVTAPTSTLGKTALADTTLPWDNANKEGKASQFSIMLTKRVSDIWRQVFAGQTDQVRVIVNVQSAYAAEADESFTFLNAAYGASANYFYAIAVAPYFNIDSDSNADSVDDIFTDLQTILATSPAASDGNR